MVVYSIISLSLYRMSILVTQILKIIIMSLQEFTIWIRQYLPHLTDQEIKYCFCLSNSDHYEKEENQIW